MPFFRTTARKSISLPDGRTLELSERVVGVQIGGKRRGVRYERHSPRTVAVPGRDGVRETSIPSETRGLTNAFVWLGMPLLHMLLILWRRKKG